MTHRAAKLVLYLLAGACVSLAVAWTCAAFGPFSKQLLRSTQWDDQAVVWWDREYPFDGYARPQRPAAEPEADDSDPYKRVTFARTDSMRWFGWGGMDVLFISGTQTATGRPARVQAMRIHSGWPCRSMTASHWRWLGGGPSPPLVGAREIVNDAVAIDPPSISQAQDTMSFLMGRRYLPLKPLWLGLCVNAIFYAAILWLLIAGSGALRRAVRHRRGQCAACGYPVGASPVCTECGALTQPGTSGP